jgi:MoaA/NifB/PqqE/SkfB family radical SAM enzyme
MIELIPRIILYKLNHAIGWPRLLPMNYTVSVTYQCNSHCSTCNIYKKKAENLSVQEYDEIFRNIGHSPYWITISGGEPFLRKDLAEICRVICKRGKPKILNIPSNGILTDRIAETVARIVEENPEVQVIINLSLDGVGEQHDAIRNIPGNYQRTLATYRKLRQIKAPNLAIGIHTVISNYNVTDFARIANTLIALKPDSYITEIAEERVELDTMGSGITPSLVEYRSAVDFLIHRIKNQKFDRISRITQAFRVEYYNLVKHILRDKTQVIPCYSGVASVQIAPDGEIWPCCIKAKSFGNLRNHDYDLKEIWFSPAMEAERKTIRAKACWCPMANASYTNMLMDIPTLWRVFVRSFIRWWT